MKQKQGLKHSAVSVAAIALNAMAALGHARKMQLLNQARATVINLITMPALVVQFVLSNAPAMQLK